MIKTTTQNEVILNVYRETGEIAQKNFQTECLLNSVLSNEKDDFEDLKLLLESLQFQPRQKSLDEILNYSSTFMRSQ